MSIELISRLRGAASCVSGFPQGDLLVEAANEIERLEILLDGAKNGNAELRKSIATYQRMIGTFR